VAYVQQRAVYIAWFEQIYTCTATVQSDVNGFVMDGLWQDNDSKFNAKFNMLELPFYSPQGIALDVPASHGTEAEALTNPFRVLHRTQR